MHRTKDAKKSINTAQRRRRANKPTGEGVGKGGGVWVVLLSPAAGARRRRREAMGRTGRALGSRSPY